MDEPDYLICIECETPCYIFEWRGTRLIEAVCESCGNDDTESFATPDEWEAMTEG